MKILILGSTGMLGQALTIEAHKRNYEVIGIARENADFCIDITDDQTLKKTIDVLKPNLIINTVAIVSHKICQENPALAYITNARPVAVLSEIARQKNIYLVQISTDHYYTGDYNLQHSEKSPIRLVNEYAMTKYAAEQFSLIHQKSLVVRTNIVGFRYKSDSPSFAEWVFSSLVNQQPMSLFDDFFTSSIDVTSFAKILFDMLAKEYFGLLNIANREVFSKKTFIEAIANSLGCGLENTKLGSIFDLKGGSRAESLGLDVSKAEKILGYNLPTMKEVVANLVSKYQENNP